MSEKNTYQILFDNYTAEVMIFVNSTPGDFEQIYGDPKSNDKKTKAVYSFTTTMTVSEIEKMKKDCNPFTIIKLN